MTTAAQIALAPRSSGRRLGFRNAYLSAITAAPAKRIRGMSIEPPGLGFGFPRHPRQRKIVERSGSEPPIERMEVVGAASADRHPEQPRERRDLPEHDRMGE